MRVLSVDLGTSNTVAVLSAHERAPWVVDVDGSSTMPSAVFALPDGGLVVGREAVRRARTDPARFEPNPKRRIDEGQLLLGDRVVAVSEALAAILARVLAEVSRQLGGERPDKVCLTHPARWGAARRAVLTAAAHAAGVPDPVLLPEPVAAAAHFASFPGRSLPAGQALAVYDLGAGTFDASVVANGPGGFTVLGAAGLDDVGGLDVDDALLACVERAVAAQDPETWQRLRHPGSMAERRATRLLWDDVRAAKETLSAHPQAEVVMPPPFGDALVTRDELEAAVHDRLARSVHLLGDTIASAGREPATLAGIYLVGGSSRMPLVAKLIAEKLGVVPVSLDMPETAVALGAHPATRPAPVQKTPQKTPQQPLPKPPPLSEQFPIAPRVRPLWPRIVVLSVIAIVAVVVAGLLSR